MITLPALCFDKLAISIDTHGLGAGRYYRFDPDTEAPVPCDFVGHFETCFGESGFPPHRFGITGRISDKAVYAINERKHHFRRSLVTWQAFIAELDIVRGPEHSCDLSTHESSVKYEEREVPNGTGMEKQSLAG